MADAKPPIAAELVWSDELRFGATSGRVARHRAHHRVDIVPE